jgi:hypothetical protein
MELNSEQQLIYGRLDMLKACYALMFREDTIWKIYSATDIPATRLAIQLGVSYSTLMTYLHGHQTPKIEVLMRLYDLMFKNIKEQRKHD